MKAKKATAEPKSKLKQESKSASESKMKPTYLTALLMLGVSVLYAFVRYNIFKGVPLANFPLYVMNKSVALAAVGLIALSFLMRAMSLAWPKVFGPKLYLRKWFGLFGFGFAAIHAMMSLLLFNASNYPKFFVKGQLSLVGELSMLFGILAFFVFSIVALTSLPAIAKAMKPQDWQNVQRTGYIAFFLVLLHVFVMGFEGWLTPDKWPGGLLPISLIAFIIIVFVLLVRLGLMLFAGKKPGAN